MSAAFDARLGPHAEAPAKVHLNKPMDPRFALGLLAVLALGLFYMAYSIRTDIADAGGGPTTILPFILLGVALLIALGFEFVNGFHDTANAVATVIYTHALPAQVAVVWSGCWNLLGVLASTGAVAFGVVSLLPVELILQVGSAAGYAMVFALLISAIIWNLGTWWMGIPASSSHTLIGSIVGVGVANAIIRGQNGTAGVDWDQVTKVGEALLFSPFFGFALSALLLLAMKAVIRVPELYTAPKTNKPPSIWIRGLLILTCTLVSFFHGSNDGQKGMGLIMLILIGVAPTAYALNRAPAEGHAAAFVTAAHAASKIVEAHGAGYAITGDPRPAVTEYVHSHTISEGTYPSLAVLTKADQRLGRAIRLRRQDAARQGPEPSQRHVSRLGGLPRPGEGQGERAVGRRTRRRSAPSRRSSMARPSSSRSGSRSAWRSRWASARWLDGSVSSSPSAKRSARPT